MSLFILTIFFRTKIAIFCTHIFTIRRTGDLEYVFNNLGIASDEIAAELKVRIERERERERVLIGRN